MKEKAMRVMIVIPHYGDKEVLVECVESLKEVKVNKLLIDKVIIDNNPPHENRGFTRAVNDGIRKYRGYKGADYFWILNNDTVVDENALIPMVRLMRRHPRIGIVSSKILSYENPDFIHHGGTLRCFPTGIHKTGYKSMESLNVSTQEKWVTFCSVLINAKLIDEIGLLDERYFFIGQDSDYCYRARAANWQVWYCAESEVLHRIGQAQNPKPEVQQIMRMDMQCFFDKWLSSRLFTELDREVLDGEIKEEKSP